MSLRRKWLGLRFVDDHAEDEYVQYRLERRAMPFLHPIIGIIVTNGIAGIYFTQRPEDYGKIFVIVNGINSAVWAMCAVFLGYLTVQKQNRNINMSVVGALSARDAKLSENAHRYENTLAVMLSVCISTFTMILYYARLDCYPVDSCPTDLGYQSIAAFCAIGSCIVLPMRAHKFLMAITVCMATQWAIFFVPGAPPFQLERFLVNCLFCFIAYASSAVLAVAMERSSRSTFSQTQSLKRQEPTGLLTICPPTSAIDDLTTPADVPQDTDVMSVTSSTCATAETTSAHHSTVDSISPLLRRRISWLSILVTFKDEAIETSFQNEFLRTDLLREKLFGGCMTCLCVLFLVASKRYEGVDHNESQPLWVVGALIASAIVLLLPSSLPFPLRRWVLTDALYLCFAGFLVRAVHGMPVFTDNPMRHVVMWLITFMFVPLLRPVTAHVNVMLFVELLPLVGQCVIGIEMTSVVGSTNLLIAGTVVGACIVTLVRFFWDSELRASYATLVSATGRTLVESN